jgi:hypothetical protein
MEVYVNPIDSTGRITGWFGDDLQFDLNCKVDSTDHNHRGQTGTGIYLHLDDHTFQADHRTGKNTRQHGLSVDGKRGKVNHKQHRVRNGRMTINKEIKTGHLFQEINQ